MRAKQTFRASFDQRRDWSSIVRTTKAAAVVAAFGLVMMGARTPAQELSEAPDATADPAADI
jgi:hypothetical protein